jgi:hypothetical protein
LSQIPALLHKAAGASAHERRYTLPRTGSSFARRRFDGISNAALDTFDSVFAVG